MRKATICIWLGAAGAITAVGAWLAVLRGGEDPFSVSLEFGYYCATNRVVLASLTNRTHHAVELQSVRIESKQPAGNIDVIYGIHGSSETVKPGKGVTTLCCIPADAEQVRVGVSYDDSPRYWKFTGWLARKARLDRHPTAVDWLSKKRLMGAPAYHFHFSPWVANKGAAVKGGMTGVFDPGRARPALPERCRYA
jgi:hypothetical protein